MKSRWICAMVMMMAGLAVTKAGGAAPPDEQRAVFVLLDDLEANEAVRALQWAQQVVLRSDDLVGVVSLGAPSVSLDLSRNSDETRLTKVIDRLRAAGSGPTRATRPRTIQDDAAVLRTAEDIVGAMGRMPMPRSKVLIHVSGTTGLLTSERIGDASRRTQAPSGVVRSVSPTSEDDLRLRLASLLGTARSNGVAVHSMSSVGMFNVN